MPLATLSEQMDELLDYVRRLIDAGEREHQVLFYDAANEFNLYKDNQAPLWLSRVIEGELRDRDNGDGHWQGARPQPDDPFDLWPVVSGVLAGGEDGFDRVIEIQASERTAPIDPGGVAGKVCAAH